MNFCPSRESRLEGPEKGGAAAEPHKKEAQSGAILCCEEISMSYGGELILSEVSVELRKGELVSILGASGTGKTTLFNVLSGLERPDKGRVFFRGEDVTGVPGKVSYMQQKDLLLPFRTILDNVSAPLRLRGADKKMAREQAREYFGEFGIAGCEDKYPSQLSGGMRQRAALLRSYLFQGDVMLLDEPFSALDAMTKAAMHQWYQSVCRKHETSAFLITHDIDEAILLSDRIYIITGQPGRIRTQLTIARQGERDSEFTMSEPFLSCKREILSYL